MPMYTILFHMRHYVYAYVYGMALSLSLSAQPSADLKHRLSLYSYVTDTQHIQFYSTGWEITDHSSYSVDYTFLESHSSVLPKIEDHTLFYKNFYSQIHMKVHVGTSSMKYDFIVDPKGQLSDICLRIRGGSLTLADPYRFTVHTPDGMLEESIPFSYQVIAGDTLSRNVRYIQKDHQTLGFTADYYDPNYPLIIDPELLAASLTGSSADQFGNTATFDGSGNIYAGGEIYGQSTGRYTAIGAYEKAFAGGLEPGPRDISITKFNPTGTDVLYFTYLGGAGNETPSSLVVDDASGDLIIYGITSSDNFPVPPPATPVYDRTHNGNVDIVLARLNSDGTTLISSTFVGGAENDGVLEIRGVLAPNYKDEYRGEVIIDRDGSIVFVSSTLSTDFPVTSGSHGGKYDGVIGKMSGNLSSMEWSYYIGGSGEDALFDVDTVASGYYITGGTTSTNLPITSLTSSYKRNKTPDDPSHIRHEVDGFIMHIRRSDQNINYGTYIGTDRFDQSYFIEVDHEGAVYILGQTTSSSYPIQAPTGSSIYSIPEGKLFLHQFDATLTRSLWSTVVGTRKMRDLAPTAFLVDVCDQIYLSGWGGLRNASLSMRELPITSDGLQQTTNGSDFYLMVLSPDASALTYASFFGGPGSLEHVDGGTSRFDDQGIVYQAVCYCRQQDGFPATPNAWANVNPVVDADGNVYCNMGFFKFELKSSIAKFSTNNQEDTDPGIDSGCIPLTIVFKNESIGGEMINSEWDFGEGTFTTNENRPVPHTFTQPGTFRVRLRISSPVTTCVSKAFIAEKVITVYDDTVLVSEDQALCIGEEVQLYASGGVRYKWSPDDLLSDASSANPVVKNLEHSQTYKAEITTPNGCKKTDSVFLSAQVPPSVSLSIEPQDLGCAGSKNFFISSQITGGADYVTWSMGDGNYFEDISELNYTYKSSGVHTITVEAGNEICYTKFTEQIFTSNLFVPNAITPNEDGLNDYLDIEEISKLDADHTIQVQLKIFDRNGSVVYHTNDYRNDWNGQNLPAGVYYYAIETSTQEICKGWLHLIK